MGFHLVLLRWKPVAAHITLGAFVIWNGHESRLMSPLDFRSYVNVNKTDDRDAEAIAEATTRPTMSFVAINRKNSLTFRPCTVRGSVWVWCRTGRG